MSMNFQILYHNKQYFLAVLHVSDFLDNNIAIKRARDEAPDTRKTFLQKRNA